MEIGRDDDLLAPDEYLIHEVLEELVAGLGCVNGGLCPGSGGHGLGGNVVVSAMNSLFSAMGVRLASRKLAQIVPVAGVVVSAGLNAALMRTIGETADHLYRERFLAERYGRVETSDGASTDLARSADSQELSADIARYVEIAEAESRP